MNEGLLVTQPQTPVPTSVSEADATSGADVRVKLKNGAADFGPAFSMIRT